MRFAALVAILTLSSSISFAKRPDPDLQRRIREGARYNRCATKGGVFCQQRRRGGDLQDRIIEGARYNRCATKGGVDCYPRR